MALKTTAQLKSEANSNINTNGVNAITGALHNAMLNNIIDSMVNKSTDALSIVTNVYRVATKTIGSTPTQITFSSALPSVNYEIIIFDTNGIGWENITNKLATGFKITGLTAGDIIYLAILTN
ncbi:hypothetical protein LCGC14_0770940 [marine sediment metagenome]|uniref:Uncharacterized protein n=1 Tax=marine sediment metagenome TaxID=412755 RepID=A0A0F9SID7_9ZZZZ